MQQYTKRKCKIRYIICPSCGEEVRIPFFWMVGIEGIFRCKVCRCHFKTGYKMGAVLSALALTVIIAAAQLLVFVFGSMFTTIAIIAVIPAWLLLAASMRKRYMMRKLKTFTKFAEQNRCAQTQDIEKEEEHFAEEE